MSEASQGAAPDLNAICAYAKKQVELEIGKKVKHLPKEQREDIRQDAILRVCEKYRQGELDVTRGWKAYVQQHCRGAVLDYLRGGHGFEESRESLSKSEEDQKAAAAESQSESEPTAEAKVEANEQGQEGKPENQDAEPKEKRFSQPLRHRVCIRSEDDGRVLDVEEVAGLFGISSEAEKPRKLNVNWDLVARMARKDANIHLVAKMLIGNSKPDLAPQFEVSRERLYQRLQEFFEELDSPEMYGHPWTEQTIYAFGLSEIYHMEPKDNGLGWNYEPVDLWDEDSTQVLPDLAQMELFRVA